VDGAKLKPGQAAAANPNPAADEGGEVSAPIASIAVKVVAPPTYDVITTTMGKDSGVQMIDAALERIEKTILKHKGSFKVVSRPEVIGEDADEDVDDEEDEKKKDDSDSDSDSTDEEVEGMGNIDIPEE